MADQHIATHESTEAQDWSCAHCQTHGNVVIHARGVGSRQVWLSDEKAEHGAHEDAAVALQRDAQRILALVKCPSCNRRAPGALVATLWHGLKDLLIAITTGATVGFITWAVTSSTKLGIVGLVIAFLVCVAIGQEARRWREASRAVVDVAKPRGWRSSRAARADRR